VIQLVFFLALGLGFLGMLIFIMRRGRATPEGGAVALIEARGALDTLQGSLMPPELIGRIFEQQDLEYIEASTPAEVREFFLRERSQIALLWIRQVRTQLVSLRRFYTGRSRYYAQISAGTELSLGLNFLVLLSACRLLEVLVYVRGPFAAPRIVGATITRTAKICDFSAEKLEFLRPENPSEINRDRAGNEAI
jgi:hypothetical protein